MSDPNKDWLDDELANLHDIEAPATLLPKVMKEVSAWGRSGNVRLEKCDSWSDRIEPPSTEVGKC